MVGLDVVVASVVVGFCFHGQCQPAALKELEFPS